MKLYCVLLGLTLLAVPVRADTSDGEILASTASVNEQASDAAELHAPETRQSESQQSGSHETDLQSPAHADKDAQGTQGATVVPNGPDVGMLAPYLLTPCVRVVVA